MYTLSQRSGYVNTVIKTGKDNSRHRFIISVSNRLVHRINIRFKMSCHQKFVLLVLDRTHPHYYHVCNTIIRMRTVSVKLFESHKQQQ